MAPTYDFQCPRCAARIEQRRDFADTSPAPWCGDCCVEMSKVFTATPAIFKGKGWAKVPKL